VSSEQSGNGDHGGAQQDGTEAKDKPSPQWLTFLQAAGRCLRSYSGAFTMVATVAYVIVAGFQLSAMRGQLKEMKGTSVQTDKTIVALNDQAGSLKAQLAALRAFQRAFVAINAFLESAYDVGQPPHHTLHFMWGNSGNTPTRNLTIKLGCVSSDPGSVPAFNFDPKLTSSTLILPKGLVTQGACTISHDEMVEYAQHWKNLFVIAEADYGDISDPNPTHVTQYCAILHGLRRNPLDMQPAGGVQMFAAPNVSMEQCSLHNCADEECRRQP
jgi:hypothetical protein